MGSVGEAYVGGNFFGIFSTFCFLIASLHFGHPLSPHQDPEVRVQGPSYVKRGAEATLKCSYDLGLNNKLYSVKWYKDNMEFFRYTPGGRPVKQVFPLLGITVDAGASGAEQVVLRSIGERGSGLYSCEVICDGPLFKAARAKTDILVIEPPTESPRINGLRDSYLPGDTVELNCSSGYSKPSVSLSWYIDGQMAEISALRDYPPIERKDNLERSLQGLKIRLPTEPSQRQIPIKCTASIERYYFEEVKASLRISRRPERSLAPSNQGVEDIIAGGGSSTTFRFPENLILLVGILFSLFLTY